MALSVPAGKDRPIKKARPAAGSAEYAEPQGSGLPIK
jgi:hypothetical protein